MKQGILTINAGSSSIKFALFSLARPISPEAEVSGQIDGIGAEMTKLIIANTKVGDTELKQLAADRVATVRAFLTDSGKMAQERLFLKGDTIYKAPDKEKSIASRVELNPILP